MQCSLHHPHRAPPLTLSPPMLPQAETRAEFAERSVAKLEKTIDDLEGTMSLLALYPSFPGSTCWDKPLVGLNRAWPG